MKQRYLICLHDLKDLRFWATEEQLLFDKATNSHDLCEWVNDNEDNLEYLCDNISGITVIDMVYGLQY